MAFRLTDQYDAAQVNLPLSKRYGKGGIDAAIDQHKAEQAKAQRAARKATSAAYAAALAECRSIIAAIPDHRAAELGRPHGLTAKQARAALLSRARSGPERALVTLRREVGQGECCATCADWRAGECWSGDRLDGDLAKGPADRTLARETCEAWRAPSEVQVKVA